MDNMERQNKEATPAESISVTIPVLEETLHVGKQVVDKGRITFQKRIHEEIVEVPFFSRNKGYAVERVTVNRYVDNAPPAVRYEGAKMVLSILEEEVVVQKRLKLVEELHITPTEEDKAESFEVTLKKERINIIKDQEQ